MIVLDFFTRTLGRMEQAPETSGYLTRPRRFMGPDSFSLPTHRLHSFRDANCKSHLRRVFFSKMKLQMSNRIIAHKHLAEDSLLSRGGGGGLGWEKGHTHPPSPCCCTVSAALGAAPTQGEEVPWTLTGDWKLSRGTGEVGRQGHLVKLKLQINSERVSGVLFVWFWSRV